MQLAGEGAGRVARRDVAGRGEVAGDAEQFLHLRLAGDKERGQRRADALGTQRADPAKLAALLGSDWQSFIPIEGVERADVDAFLKAYRERHSIETASDGKARLVVGSASWTLPIPMAKAAVKPLEKSETINPTDCVRFDLSDAAPR